MPGPKEVKNILNEKVKFRESFRPFAPMIKEKFIEYIFLDHDIESPYMSFACKVKNEYLKKIPAVVHVNQRARVQTINEKFYPQIFELLSQIELLTSLLLPVILNTSLNIRGEPIVCTPEEAIILFKKTGIDCLILGNYLLYK